MSTIQIKDSKGTISGRGSNFVIIKFIPFHIRHFEIIPSFCEEVELL
jgi:hypothetical protein